MKLIKSAKTGTYRVRIATEHGHRTIRTGVKTKEEALKIIHSAKVPELERAARTVRLTNEVVQQIRFGKSVKAADALAQWEEHLSLYSGSAKTALNKIICVRAWLRDAKLLNLPTHTLKPAHVDAFINNPASKDKAGTRNFKLSCLRSFFTFCSAREFILANPCQGINVRLDRLTHRQKEPAKPRAFTAAEFAGLMKYIEHRATELEQEQDGIIERMEAYARSGGHTGAFEGLLEDSIEACRRLEVWRVASLIGRHTGLRLGDVCRLETASIADTPGRLIVWTGKTDKRVSLPLPAELQQTLAELGTRNPGTIFCFPEEAATYNDVKKCSGLSIAFTRLCAAAGVFGRGFHSLRSMYAHECRAAGIATPHIAERLGHSHTDTTDIYLQ